MHRIDAASAQDRRYELESPLAVAAIEDWLGTIASRGWAANVPGFADAMRGHGQSIVWIADNTDRVWHLRRTDADAPLVLTHARGKGDVTVHGPARELLEIISRRRPLDDAVESIVVGDRAELIHLIDNMNWVGAA